MDSMISCRTCGAPVLEAVHVATALRDALGPRGVGAVSSERPIERIVVGYRALIDVVDDAAAQLRGFCSGACERAPQAPESEATQAARHVPGAPPLDRIKEAARRAARDRAG